jgi:hypothetical protein
MKAGKITDKGQIPRGSRGDFTAEREGFAGRLRKPEAPQVVLDIGKKKPEDVIAYFQLKGIEFGRWVNFNDRLDYQQAAVTAFHDLNSILLFKGANIGLDRLVLAIGARGRNAALAHFEPGNDTINLTRYHRPGMMKDKLDRVEFTGGVSSFAHEYGHYLDYFFGSYIDQNPSERSLTGGASIATRYKSEKAALRKQMDQIINAIIWEVEPAEGESGKYTAHYEKLHEYAYPKKTYWIRRTELFARAFEVYICFKLKDKGVRNLALTHSPSHYDRAFVYIDKAIREKVFDRIDHFINMLRKVVNTGLDISELKPQEQGARMKPAAEKKDKPEPKKRTVADRSVQQMLERSWAAQRVFIHSMNHNISHQKQALSEMRKSKDSQAKKTDIRLLAESIKKLSSVVSEMETMGKKQPEPLPQLKEFKDPAQAAKLIESINEGNQILLSGKKVSGEKHEIDSLRSIAASIKSARKKLAGMERDTPTPTPPTAPGDGKKLYRKGKGEYLIIDDYFFENDKLKEGKEYEFRPEKYKAYLVEAHVTANKHVVKGDHYTGNGTPQQAIELREKVLKLKEPLPAQSQLYKLAFDKLKIPIPEYKKAIDPGGEYKKIEPLKPGEPFVSFFNRVNKVTRQIPRLYQATDKDMLTRWWIDEKRLTLIGAAKSKDLDQIGAFVNLKSYEIALRDRPEKPTPPAGPEKPQAQAPDFDSLVSREDIPYQVAYNAHTGTSFSPEKRAKSEQADYYNSLKSAYERIMKRTPKGKENEARNAFIRFRDGYKKSDSWIICIVGTV